jgi:hypothetical protein
MKKYLQECKLLSIIDIPFLREMSKSKEWDRLFYEMFDLLISMEDKTEEFFIYNRDRLFFLKKEGSMEIEIREATDFCVNGKMEELVIVVNQAKGKEQSVLVPKIIDYLKGKGIGYRLLDEEQKSELFQQDITEIISINRLTG